MKTNYVINSDNDLIYKISNVQLVSKTANSEGYLSISLELVAGHDYIDPDYSDEQGWVAPENFVEDVQYESVLQYFESESLLEALDANGWYPTELPSTIHPAIS